MVTYLGDGRVSLAIREFADMMESLGFTENDTIEMYAMVMREDNGGQWRRQTIIDWNKFKVIWWPHEYWWPHE